MTYVSATPVRVLLKALGATAGVLILLAQTGGLPLAAQCGPNPIVCENSQAGAPASEWDISGLIDPTLQGFATDFSVNKGEAVHFKVSTTANNFTIDIYRLGYYGGLGARKAGSLTAVAGQNQPNCLFDITTHLTDCGNWTESASWLVPATAVSGMYIAKLSRADTGGASHIPFVVRDDASTSDLLMQTSDTTWQAYNEYGGFSLYTSPRATKVSYNRPLMTRAQNGGFGPPNYLFYAEYPMARWLEANGYDVSYLGGVDTDRRGALIKNHKAFLSVGHDEYWSGQQRANVEAARAAGVHLAFFTGNGMVWKTRWESSIDSSAAPYRTLVTYKETHAGQKIDPAGPATWTGTWRDPRFSPPGDGGRPENALTGQIWTVDRGSTAIRVPATFSNLRFWRNTSVAELATGQSATLAPQTLGYEWDEDLDNGFRPAGLIPMSLTTVDVPRKIVDFGTAVAPGTATHNLTLYRHSSGALVFGAGTVQWSWGLDTRHDNSPDTGSPSPDPTMQQATINLFADMDAQPATLQAGMFPADPSTDTSAPASTIASPVTGESAPAESMVTIAGTAVDSGGGVVGVVEVSVDGGATWHRAAGRESWTYTWRPGVLGTASIMSRAVDDSGNIESNPTIVAITITPAKCPCTIWDAAAVPKHVDVAVETSPVELGVKFRTDTDGQINGVRFYKAAANTGTHVGNLWSSSGTLLATATFVTESASGWQEVSFASPVKVTANTTYVASYHTNTGRYSHDSYFFGRAGVDQSPLHALADGVHGANGVYVYGASAFPTQTYQAGNYWVDVVFDNPAADVTPPSVTSVTPTNGATAVSVSTSVRTTFSEALNAATVTASSVVLRDAGNAVVPSTVSYNPITRQAILAPTAPLAPLTTYTATIAGGSGGVKDVAGNALPADVTWSFTTISGATCPCTIWSSTTTPARIAADDGSAVELGMRFRADADGMITAVRFYKAAANTGTHTGSLWSNSGTLLATATFSNETASGWQQVSFPTPVTITANTTYVISYHTDTGNYGIDGAYFASAGVDVTPLHALANGVDGMSGVYQYGDGGFPTETFNAANYWVDVVFAHASADVTAPTVTNVAPASGADDVGVAASVTATFSEAVKASTVTASTLVLRDGANAVVPGTVSYNPATRRATLTPAAPLASSATYTALIVAGSGGVQDLAGNELVANLTWSFTTATLVTCPCTIWNAAAAPAQIANDGSAVELGVRFRADFDGIITGVRFYKWATNTGLHTGSLWSNSGTLLATATFANETASGWQQVSFSPAVDITANTTYVVSYHTNTGRYGLSGGYFASAGAGAAPLRALAHGVDGPNGVYRYGAGAFPTESFNATNYWVDAVFDIRPPDTTPPTVTSVAPASGATDVAVAGHVAATFSEALNPATVTASSVVLRDAGNAVVPGTVSYNAATRGVTLTPAAPLATSTTYTVTIPGGSGGVTDVAGNALVSTVTWSFTTASVVTCPCTIWNGAATPAYIADDGNAVELGMRFRADADGMISGVRFYKGAANTGTHTGTLWSNSGTLLATATFINETASGWQQVDFPAPVTITANTTYVVSYHTSAGHYAINSAYFASAGVDATPLHALANGVDGASGVYRYGAGGFPTDTFDATNYWVDVVFDRGAPDTTPPAVNSVAPAGGATDVSPATSVVATFTEALNPATVTASTVVLRGAGNVVVPSTVSYNPLTRAVTLTPTASLAMATIYTATVLGGSSGVKDAVGNALATTVTWSFTTASVVTCPCTIWNAAATPAQIADDASAVELGLRFRADADGTITGVRFYKAASNTGIHTGSLWTNGGTLLATATFSNESASGWQEVSFATPVAITANTTYVVSYHTNTGHYAFTGAAFASGGVDNGPLHALAAGADSGNGLYRYGPGAFPTETYNAANYWVDVVYR
jgi:hypothetical protein